MYRKNEAESSEFLKDILPFRLVHFFHSLFVLESRFRCDVQWKGVELGALDGMVFAQLRGGLQHRENGVGLGHFGHCLVVEEASFLEAFGEAGIGQLALVLQFLKFCCRHCGYLQHIFKNVVNCPEVNA